PHDHVSRGGAGLEQHVVDREQDDRAHDRSDEMHEAVRGPPAQVLAHPSGEDRAHDADDDGDDEADRVLAAADELGDDADDEADDDDPEPMHIRVSPCVVDEVPWIVRKPRLPAAPAAHRAEGVASVGIMPSANMGMHPRIVMTQAFAGVSGDAIPHAKIAGFAASVPHEPEEVMPQL